MEPAERIEQTIERLGAEGQRVHLFGYEEDALLLENRCVDFHDVFGRKGREQTLETQLVGIRETRQRRDSKRADLLKYRKLVDYAANKGST